MASTHERRLGYYRDGLTDREIGDLEGVSKAAIRTWRAYHDLPSKHRSTLSSGSSLSAECQAKRLSLYREGLNDREIAAASGVSHYSVLSWRHWHNLPANFRPRRLGPDPKKHEARLALHRQGLRDLEIARRLGEAYSTIWGWRKIQGLPNFKYLRVNLYRTGAVDSEIAAECHCSLHAVFRWRKRRRLKPNKRSRTIGDAMYVRRLLHQEGLHDGIIGIIQGRERTSIRSWRKRQHLDRNAPATSLGLDPSERDLRFSYHRVGMTDRQMASALGKDVSTIRQWRRANSLTPNTQRRRRDIMKPNYVRTLSLDATFRDGGGSLLDVVADRRQSAWAEEMGATVW